MADTTVKYFDSTMIGAPTLTGVAGSLIGILDACLVNGFGSGTLDSLVVAGGIATATRAAGHSQVKDGVAFIAGSSIALLNGEQKVTNVTTTTFQFATTAGNGTATGTITAKVAPANWSKLFTGTNLAAYKSTDVASTACVLRVDDTTTTAATVVGYETMSDVNTGTGQFPTTGQLAASLKWDKSSSANATANAWILVADGRFMYFGRAYRSGNNADLFGYQLSVFGDIVPTKAGDAYSCIITGETSSQFSSSVVQTANFYGSAVGTALGAYAPRAYTGLGSSMPMGHNSPTLNGVANPYVSGAAALGTPYPNPTDGGFYLFPHYLFDSISNTSNNVHRGTAPGFYCTPQLLPPSQFNTRDSVTGITNLAGKTLKAMSCISSAGAPGACFFDVTGPWR